MAHELGREELELVVEPLSVVFGARWGVLVVGVLLGAGLAPEFQQAAACTELKLAQLPGLLLEQEFVLVCTVGLEIVLAQLATPVARCHSCYVVVTAGRLLLKLSHALLLLLLCLVCCVI